MNFDVTTLPATWTPQALRILAKMAAQRRKPADAAMSFDALSIFHEAISPTPDEWQIQLLTSTADRVLARCSRQSGKSSVQACRIASEILSAPASTVLIVTPTLLQSSELLYRVRTVYNTLGRPLGATSDSALRLSLSNGSRVICLSAERSLRGFSPSLVCIDESQGVEDNTYYACRPLLASTRGRLLATGTSKGMFGWYYEAFEGNTSTESWERYVVPASQVSHLDAVFLENERKALPSAVYDAEYNCIWLSDSFGVWSSQLVGNAFAKEVATLW